MKKIIVILLAAVMVMAPSCKNAANKKAQKEAETKALTTKEQILTEDLKANLKNLVESTKQMKAVSFMKVGDDRIQLSDKEKMVKPDYLTDPAAGDQLVTLTQKYRFTAMLNIDRYVAYLYDMPFDDIEAAISKQLVDINDPLLKEFQDGFNGEGPDFAGFFDKEIEAGRANFFWEAVTAGFVEQIYILTKNIDKFMPMFDDQAVADVTYNFVCVHDCIEKMIEVYPEMASLQEAMTPLYVINAVSVDELKTQLTELKGQIEVVRAYLLK